jgi:hypothetical protein
MADSHDSHGADADPNVAPSHLDVRFDFSNVQVAFCVGLGLIAVVAGIVVGLTVTNT